MNNNAFSTLVLFAVTGLVQAGAFAQTPASTAPATVEKASEVFVEHSANVFRRFNGDGVKYGDVFLENERELSTWNFEVADTNVLFDQFKKAAAECANALQAKLPIPAYEQAIKASHIFNTLQARGVISVAERQAYIGRVRDLAKGACAAWMEKNGWSA